MAVIAPSRIAAPTRDPWRFGLLSVAEVDDDSDPHWTLGGGEAEADDCLPALSTANDPCDDGARVDVEVVHASAESIPGYSVLLDATGRMERQQASKDLSAGYAGTIDADPFTLYLLTECYSVGWMGGAGARAKTAYQNGEEAAVTATLAARFTDGDPEDLGASDCLAEGIGSVESYFGGTYGIQPLVLIPLMLGPMAFRANLLVRAGDHLETQTGSKVALYPDLSGGGAVVGVGGLRILRSPLAVNGPQMDLVTNQSVVLSERSYLPVIACGVAVSAVVEDCLGRWRVSVRVGETFIHGRGTGSARAILAAARRLGVAPNRIRATDTGYIVPNEVADELDTEPRWAAPNAVF